MAGRGPAPKEDRRRSAEPARGEWEVAGAVGWQYGEPPAPPGGNKLRQPTREAWTVWMRSWFAAHWTPADLPGLRLLIRLYDAVERGDLTRSTELRQLMDAYGITPKGQQDRRWTRPDPTTDPGTRPAAKTGSPYDHLRTVVDNSK